MQDNCKRACVTYLCIAGFWLFYPIAFTLIAIEYYWGICFKVNLVILLILLFSGIPVGTYGIYRTDWNRSSKVTVWFVCVMAVIGCILPFGFLIAYFFGVIAT